MTPGYTRQTIVNETCYCGKKIAWKDDNQNDITGISHYILVDSYFTFIQNGPDQPPGKYEKVIGFCSNDCKEWYKHFNWCKNYVRK